MILPKTFVNPIEYLFLCSDYSGLVYCSHSYIRLKYIFAIDNQCSEESNILKDTIDHSYIIEKLKEWELDLYKKELMKEMNIKFKYIKC